MLSYDTYTDTVTAVTWNQYKLSLPYMSEQTAETILARYRQDELKQYLGIIIYYEQNN